MKPQLSLRTRKIPCNPDLYHLVIGLGGTGVTAALEVKGLISQTCLDSEKHVAFLAFDTASITKEYQSSDATGNARFAEKKELYILDDSSCDGVFVPAKINGTMSQNPELFTWADERLNPTVGGNGANQTRQVGRLILYKNYDEVREVIKATIRNLITNAGDGARLMVYLISGIGGGTGSGTCLDVGFIVRDVLTEPALGFAANRHSLYAYFTMPDVSLEKGGDPKLINRNAYAALQELDYTLSLGELGESYQIHYPNGQSIKAGSGDKSLFDHVHLVSSLGINGTPVENAYDRCMRAIAQNILSFAANEQGVAQGGNTSYKIEEHYSNINAQTDSAILNIEMPHRHHRYLAIGSAEYELPIDDIMRYVTYLLFENMREMYDRPFKRPGDLMAHTENLFHGALGWSEDNIFRSLCTLVPGTIAPEPYTFKELKDGEKDWQTEASSAYQNIMMYQVMLPQRASDLAKRLCDQFDKVLADIFSDLQFGPTWANRIIMDEKNGLIARLQAMKAFIRNNYLNTSPDSNRIIADLRSSYSKALTQLKELAWYAGADDKQAKTNTVNEYGRTMFEYYQRLALSEAMVSICEKLEEHIYSQNNKIYALTTNAVEGLMNLFSDNASIESETNVAHDRAGHETFTWQTLNVPLLKDVIKNMFDEIIGDPAKTLVSDFVKKLWETGKKWIQDETRIDPQAFISEYIDAHFDSIATTSLEKVLVALLEAEGRDGRTALQNGIETTLMPELISASQPLYWPRRIGMGGLGAAVGKTIRLISVPDKCQGIFNAINTYCQNNYIMSGQNKNCILQQSSIGTRIYVQTVTCALPLSQFSAVWEAEKYYAELIDSTGLHLIHAMGQNATTKKTWKDLYTLIPVADGCRPDEQYEPARESLIKREIDKKAFVREILEGELPMGTIRKNGEDGVSNNEWHAEFRLTRPRFRLTGSKLEWITGSRDNIRVLREWDYKELGGAQLDGAMDELKRLLKDGLATLEGANEQTRSIKRKIVNYADGGGLDSRRTLDYLLENCVCAFELMRAIRQEKNKYDTIRKFLQAVEEYQREINAVSGRMFDFSKLLAYGGIYAKINAVDQGSVHAYLQGDKGSIQRLGSDRIEVTDVRVNSRLFKLYELILDAPGKEWNPRRRILKDIVAKIDSGLIEGNQEIINKMRTGIAKLKVEETYEELQRKQGISDTLLDFYARLNEQMNILISALEPQEEESDDQPGLTSSPEPKPAPTFEDLSFDD